MRCLTAIVTWPLLAHGTVLRTSGTNPGWKEVMACANQVNSLSTETQRLLRENQQVDRNCEDAKRYYESQAKLVDKSIAYYESRADERLSDGDLTKRYENRYTNLMCMKTYDAFFTKDPDTRLEVLHICIGRASLAPGSLLGGGSSLDRAANEACPQAKAIKEMEARVNMLRSAKATKVAQCQKDKKTLKAELDKKRAQEDALEDKHYGHHDDKQDLRKGVATSVEKKFCAVIQPNYKLKEEVIQEFWHNSC